MKFLSPSQIEEVLKIVEKYELTFLARHIGIDVLSKEEKSILEGYGVDLSKIKPHSSNVTEAFKFGILSQALGDAQAKKLTYKQFKTSLKEGTFIPLNKNEKATLNALQYQTYSHVKKLGGNIASDIRDGLIEVDREGRARAGKVVRDSLKEAVEKRRGVVKMVSILGEKTQKWDRDLLRIAEYNMHQAFNEGRIASIGKDSTSKVYFDVFPGACKSCIKAYLTAGYGSEPKIFSIQELRDNGTNIGRKQKDWLPTISPQHPRCRCSINEVPEGYKWDPTTRSYSKPDKESIKRVDRKSKVTVTVNKNGKETKTVI